MTDRELLALYRERMTALEATGQYRGLPMKQMTQDQRTRAEKTSEDFRAADAAIVEELIARGKPAKLKSVTLHLTSDGRNFAALEPGTQQPFGWEPIYCERMGMNNLLYHYEPKGLT